MVFRLRVLRIKFILVVFGFVGRVCCRMRRISPNIPFMLGWPSRIGWVLKIGCLGGLVRSHNCAFCVRRVSSLVTIYFFSCPFGCNIWSHVLQVMVSSHRIGGWDIELSLVCCQGPPLVLTRILRIKNQVVRLVM